MPTLLRLALLAIGISGAMSAVVPLDSPEIDPASGANALALAAGGLMVFRSRLRK